MRKILSLLIHINLVVWASSVYAQCNATYEMSTGELSLPQVHVYSESTQVGDYKVEMKNEGDPQNMCFKVKNVDLIDSSSIESDFLVKRIREKGSLLCGGRDDLLGFGYSCREKGHCGFDIDLCRAVSAAVLNSLTGPIIFIPVSTDERSKSLKDATVDILSRNTTWTSSREADWGHFTWIMFYDGQGFMVRTDSNITVIAELNGKRICVTSATTTFKNLEDEFAKRNLTWTPVLAEETSEAMSLYQRGECDAVTTDRSGLAAGKARFDDSENHRILGITISKEPLTPVIPAGDEQFLDIVKIVMFGLINAEELGITQNNVEEMITSSENPKIKLLLGVEGDFGQERLGLAKEALAQTIRAVGNYGEIYERHFGPNGVVNIPRDINQLWDKGDERGLIYAPPIR